VLVNGKSNDRRQGVAERDGIRPGTGNLRVACNVEPIMAPGWSGGGSDLRFVCGLQNFGSDLALVLLVEVTAPGFWLTLRTSLREES
jgi:hypothetical protein